MTKEQFIGILKNVKENDELFERAKDAINILQDAPHVRMQISKKGGQKADGFLKHLENYYNIIKTSNLAEANRVRRVIERFKDERGLLRTGIASTDDYMVRFTINNENCFIDLVVEKLKPFDLRTGADLEEYEPN